MSESQSEIDLDRLKWAMQGFYVTPTDVSEIVVMQNNGEISSTNANKAIKLLWEHRKKVIHESLIDSRN